MTSDSFLAALHDTDVMLPLFLSLAAGALIGLEREFKGKPAGLRTHTLVCFASALLTLLALRMGEWVAVLPNGTQSISDMSRMPHAIMTGIGFLGAGVIFREGVSVQGLTTAASLWLTAALGIVFGTGLLELATIGTVIALVVLFVLRIVQYLAPPQPSVRIELTVDAESDMDGEAVRSILAGHGLNAGPMSFRRDWVGGSRRYVLLASTRKTQVDYESLARRFQDQAGMCKLSFTPLENESVASG